MSTQVARRFEPASISAYPWNMRAGIEKERRTMIFLSRATRRDTGWQVGVNVV
jgi:hypothetical protein